MKKRNEEENELDIQKAASEADEISAVVPADDGGTTDVAEVSEDNEAAAAAAAKKKKRKIVDTVITAALVCVIVACVANIALILWRYKNADNKYTDLRSQFLKPADGSDGNYDFFDPNAAGANGFAVDFKALKEYNSDVIGWLYCEGTPINYPVVQSTDNYYYVRRGLDKEYLITGTIFADYRCTDIGEDDNYIIYGHHMRNGTIFGSLEKYSDQAYYDAHPTITYYTPDKTYLIEVFAGYVTNTEDQFYNVDFSAGQREKLIEKAREKSDFESSVQVGEDDTVVTLGTCSYAFDNARFILLGKICEK